MIEHKTFDLATPGGRIDASRHSLLALIAMWPVMRSMIDYKPRGVPLAEGGSAPRQAGPGDVPINTRVVETTMNVEAWARAITARLMAETNWQPPAGADVPTLIQHVTETRLGYLTDGDEGMRIVTDASRLYYKTRAAAFPAGSYWTCAGERATCPHVLADGTDCTGTLEALVVPGGGGVPALRCVIGGEPTHDHLIDIEYFAEMTRYYRAEDIVARMRVDYREMWTEQREGAAA